MIEAAQSTIQPTPIVKPSVEKEGLILRLRRIITYGGITYEISRTVVFLILFVLFFNTFVGTLFVVAGPSMQPNFQNGQFTLTLKAPYFLHNPKRGDVVAIKFPGNPSIRYIKRIIGLPGEQVQIRKGNVWLYNDEYPNGIKLYEEYEPFLTEPEVSWTVGPDEYFLIGDNRPNSSDSRFFGPVPREFIIGKVFLVFFPLEAFKIIPSPVYNISE
jgi:signal peptidase I